MKKIIIILLLFITIFIIILSSSYALFSFSKQGTVKNKLTTGIYSSCEYKDGTTWEFDYTGNEQTFTVPCSGEYKIETWGAQGGNASDIYIGGYGAYANGNYKIASNEILYINVGGQGNVAYNSKVDGGYNGGGSAKVGIDGNVYYDYAGSGGGATHIALKSGILSTLENNLDELLIVAAGGGGSYDFKTTIYASSGGSGGGITGTIAETGYCSNGRSLINGSQATQSSGGSSNSYSTNKYNYVASFGLGGSGISWYSGGGAGLYGGGTGFAYGANGGSSYIGNPLLTDKVMYCYNCEESSEESTKTVSTTCTNGTPTENCSKQGNGYAKITLVSAKYKDNSNKLNEIILSDNELVIAEPTLTTSSNNTSDASGLYKSTATNDGSATYYFRGNVTNNYVSFAGQTWRIVRINEDGTIRLIMANGINDNTIYKFNSSYDNYTYMYYTNSEAKTALESWYNTNLASYSDYIATGDYFCEQLKVTYSTSYNTGSATAAVYSSYTPNFNCSTDGNGKGVVNASIGLITYDEVVFAGGYYNKANSSYYLYNETYYWTMSPVGFSGSYARAWYVISSGDIRLNDVFYYDRLRPVVNLNADTLATGTGTSSDPYVVG